MAQQTYESLIEKISTVRGESEISSAVQRAADAFLAQGGFDAEIQKIWSDLNNMSSYATLALGRTRYGEDVKPEYITGLFIPGVTFNPKREDERTKLNYDAGLLSAPAQRLREEFYQRNTPRRY